MFGSAGTVTVPAATAAASTGVPRGFHGASTGLPRGFHGAAPRLPRGFHGASVGLPRGFRGASTGLPQDRPGRNRCGPTATLYVCQVGTWRVLCDQPPVGHISSTSLSAGVHDQVSTTVALIGWAARGFPQGSCWVPPPAPSVSSPASCVALPPPDKVPTGS